MSETMHKEIELLRDCDAVRIPQGTTLHLTKGSRVIITQSLGGSYTVATDTGHLVRISGENADALGFEADGTPKKEKQHGIEVEEAKIWDVLRTCYDPEIPVNIVDLGLIYDCAIERREDAGARVSVKMTLTAPGCGMGPTLAAEASSKIEALDGVDEADVELVWDPAWNQSMISEEGKMKLGMI
ncbi:MAG TPA: putative Fe-S cluster assembly protein SufT [Chthoniobacteraceae bacterium]|nr:putative Fe-S cluster assembly protein SufT [Chthoniobacteraceae bacterium]